MNQKQSSKNKEIVRRLNVPLAEEESEKLKKLAKAEDRSEGRTAQRLIREGLEKAEEEGKI
jgi:hypothetical protein